jgi:hypothetical protein
MRDKDQILLENLYKKIQNEEFKPCPCKQEDGKCDKPDCECEVCDDVMDKKD